MYNGAALAKAWVHSWSPPQLHLVAEGAGSHGEDVTLQVFAVDAVLVRCTVARRLLHIYESSEEAETQSLTTV